MEASPQAGPAGWEYHWSRTFERYYLWCPATNAARWPRAGTEDSAPEPAGEHGAAHEPQPPSSVHVDGGYAGDAGDAEAFQGHGMDGDDATVNEMDGDEAVNECFVDFGDPRVGFPDRRPAAAAHMHGWTYPPLIELLDRLLCSGRDAPEHQGVNVIIEVRLPRQHTHCARARLLRLARLIDLCLPMHPLLQSVRLHRRSSVAGLAARHGCLPSLLPRFVRAHTLHHF
eukprot:COSAG06_NODE_3967_length_4710_cov_6.208415_2_plen_228_part_00